MNVLNGQITEIETHGHLGLVRVRVGQDVFCVVVIADDKWSTVLQAGRKIRLLFKETELILGAGPAVLSCENSFQAVVRHVERQGPLVGVTVRYQGKDLQAVLTQGSLPDGALCAGNNIWVFIKANEITLSED